MKRAFILALTAIVLSSCKPQKPWSPYDNDSGASKESAAGSTITASSSDDEYNADIGDVEHAVYVDGRIGSDSAGPNVSIKDTLDRNKRFIKSNVILSPPIPESLWAEFEVKCTRNFMSTPAILRARIMVDDKVAGRFSTVLGTKAMKAKLSVRVDLLKPFQGKLPNTFLAKLEGDLYIMPVGTDENEVNPDTATSDIHSQALSGTIIRVDIESADAPAATATEVAAAPAEPAPPADPALTSPKQ